MICKYDKMLIYFFEKKGNKILKNAKKYYEATKDSGPHIITKKIINMNIKPEGAIDLGCGAGRDTTYLIKNGWNVLAIDKENTKEYIDKNLNDEERTRFRFECQNFENIKLEKTQLIVANFSIPFCSKDNFYKMWNSIVQNICKNGYFVGNFFGLNDSWKETKKEMVFLSKEQVFNLFKDEFEIIEFDEIEKDAKTASGSMKHWHIYNIIAKRNN